MLTIENKTQRARWQKFMTNSTRHRAQADDRQKYDDQILAMARDPNITHTQIRKSFPVASGYVDLVLNRARRRGEL